MKKLLGTLISVLLLGITHVGAALGAQVKIDPAGYTGLWAVDYGPARSGAAIVDLGKVDAATGAHVISLGGAELFFNVAADGTVVVRDSAAATGGVGTLTFNTTGIKVDPAYFAGNWRVVEGATPSLSGEHWIRLVRGLSFYSLEVGATGGFFFHIGTDGTVTVPNAEAASGGLRQLTLNNTERFRRRRAWQD
jgi:hypothetical protein